ncbi:transcription termination/antitermination protein NusG [Gryllotalpicola kribbensis]|uniref:Transcription termination/antitermination protein NusG n=1 Tax=Gryllotalpicola kribbensis TaxID=993084 RepID=A0ABP8ADZ2_9MICO
MAKSEREDVDWATAAEQSAEDDEAQTGSINAVDEADVDAAEHGALHVSGADGDGVDLDAVLDAIAEASDPEADEVVDEALEVPTSEDAEAVVNALEDADEEAEAEAEVDPYEAFKTELRMKPGKWYVIHSYAGFERRVKSNLENRIQSMDMQDYIFQIEVPMEDVVEIKNGQRKMVTRVRIPGYVLVRMDLNEDSWSVVRHTPGVTGFVGNAHNPTPLRFNEAFDMLKSLVQVEAAPAGRAGAKGQKAAARAIPAEVDFEIGETITIKEGSFAGLPGSISEINTQSGKLTVLVSLFERETPVELSFDQVTKL